MAKIKPIKIVAIAGRKGSGKDTAGEMFQKQYEPQKLFEHVNFADSLKDMCKRYFGLTQQEMYVQELKEKPLARWPYETPRYLMQHAAGALREIVPDIWIKNYFMNIQKRHELFREFHGDKPTMHVLTTDLRYENERIALQHAHDCGEFIVTTVKIVRNSILKGDPSELHPSETYVDEMEVDYTIINERSLQDLEDRVQNIEGSRN